MTFTKTHERRYSVTVEGPGIETATMDPAPGYDPRLPHDAAHFIVENELGIKGGVFGQLAAGGMWGTLFAKDVGNRRKARKRSETIFRENKEDALFSEHAVYAAQSRWEDHEVKPDTKIPLAELERIITKFEDFAAKWSGLPVGGSISVEWKHAARVTGRRKGKDR